MPILHNMPMSGNCYKVRLLAHQLNYPITLKDYDLHAGVTRQPEYLAKNPNGRTPMLEFEDGRCLAESNAIIFHLSENAPFQPTDSWERALMMQWMFFEQYSHEPYIAVLRYLRSYAKPDEQERRRGQLPELEKRGNAALGVMETHLAQHDWFAGRNYSIADIALYAYTHVAGEGGFELGNYPAVGRWMARVAGQPRHIPL